MKQNKYPNHGEETSLCPNCKQYGLIGPFENSVKVRCAKCGATAKCLYIHTENAPGHEEHNHSYPRFETVTKRK
ncbi:MAG: hypothetical protein WC774_03210 [Candidatus Gracilibacteria bacterium]|jgi:hypothetical protein